MTNYNRAQIATEEAGQAKTLGLEVAPVMGLMYLPTQEMTQAFIAASRTILLALTPPDSHVVRDGETNWKTQ